MRSFFSLIIISFIIYSLNCSFQASLFNKMNKDKKGENLIISPLSIFQALSLAANGAKGETQSEMLDVLQVDNITTLNQINYKILAQFQEFSTIDMANAVMTKFTPIEDFSNIAKKYSSPIEPLISAEQVNNWCSNKTKGKIDKIINKIDPNTLMIILNAVYFKGEWTTKFEMYSTKQLPFYNLGVEEVEVDTMKKIAYYGYYEDKKVQAVELQFLYDNMSAIIILPSEGIDINKYVETLSLSSEEYNKIINGLEMVKVDVQLPKFELEFEGSLNEILYELGMDKAFNQLEADFTGLRKEGELFVSEVMHKTYLKIFEYGCDAAAVTSIWIGGGGGPIDEKIYEMKINRPFLFLLRNRDLPIGLDLVFMSKIEKL